MLDLVISNDTAERQQSATSAELPGFSSYTPAPESAGDDLAGITLTSVYTYFHQHCHRLIPVAIVHRPDATVLAMTLPSGEMARVWVYPNGIGIQVKSKTHAGRWYEVTVTRCQCARFHFEHHCPHHDIAAGEAIEVWQRWQTLQGAA